MKLDSPEKIKEFLKNKPKTSLIGEDGNYYSLKNGELEIIKPNHYHSWNYVNKVHKDLTEIYSEDQRVIDIEESWELLDSHYDGIVNRKNISHEASSPLATLASLWEFGCYPPPEVMASIAETYNHYIRLSGAATLEEVFFGKPKRRLGTHSRQKASQDMLSHLAFLIQCDKINDRPILQLERAIETIERYKSSKDPETLLRAYRRGKIT
jgi:hypothetical protein